ncbi:hypothetical protein K501DRAFT_271322 [Backusella circina FSU 941]|nr:hypothetical protein K501DRAFT_271322 [Backusella circina FSU 941]
MYIKTYFSGTLITNIASQEINSDCQQQSTHLNYRVKSGGKPYANLLTSVTHKQLIKIITVLVAMFILPLPNNTVIVKTPWIFSLAFYDQRNVAYELKEMIEAGFPSPVVCDVVGKNSSLLSMLFLMYCIYFIQNALEIHGIDHH